MNIRPYQAEDEAHVLALWRACGLTKPWNDPLADIARKLTVQPEMFLVGTLPDAGREEVMASVMCGYDGHRGWVNYLAVAPAHRKHGFARALMHEAERLLTQRGAAKLNLQVRTSNAEVLAFYARLGYVQDDVVSLGKRLISDQ